MKHTFTQGNCTAEYDLDTRMFTRYEADGSTVAETRPMVDAELREVGIDPQAEQVASLNDAVNQLILDALMGGM
jgi:hypothetical protein